LLATLALFFSGCSDDDNETPAVSVTISSFSPASGAVGTVVSIIGTGFGTSGNEVKFNGTAATVTNATATQLTVAVPANATTGKVTVAVNGEKATAATDFTVTSGTVVDAPSPTLAGFSPASGVVGDEITITGTNFGTTLADITVKINGSAAEVKTVSATQISVVVPAEANTGKIVVTVKDKSLTSVDNFAILAPTIASFTPTIGAQNVSVVITGTNFSDILAQNIVKFNGVAGTVTATTGPELTVTMPAGVTTGKVSVKVGPNTATSTADLTVCSSIELIVTKVVFTSITSDNQCSYKVTVLNAGAQPLNLSNWLLQTYASPNADGSAPRQAAGGTTLTYLNKTLQSGESFEFTNSSNIIGSGVFTDYPYLVMDFHTYQGTDTECNTADDLLVKRIGL
jgi:hypothetical protein